MLRRRARSAPVHRDKLSLKDGGVTPAYSALLLSALHKFEAFIESKRISAMQLAFIGSSKVDDLLMEFIQLSYDSGARYTTLS